MKPDQLKEEIMEDEIYQILRDFIDESRGQPMNEEYETAYKKLLSLFNSHLEARDEKIKELLDVYNKPFYYGQTEDVMKCVHKLAQTPSKDLGDTE